MCCDTGNVVYKSPDGIYSLHYIANCINKVFYIIGGEFEIWCGGYGSHSDARACLACFAMNGFHITSKYEWFQNDKSLSENTPLLYTSCDGEYVCNVSNVIKTLTANFVVSCKLV